MTSENKHSDTTGSQPTVEDTTPEPQETASNAGASDSTGSADKPKKKRRRKIKVQDSPKTIKSPKKRAADARKKKQVYIASPPWIPYVGLGLIIVSILLLVLNYLLNGLPPLYNNWMFVGFAGMLAGLGVLSRWK